MSDPRRPSGGSQPRSPGRRKRRAYEPPRILSRESLETFAAVCTPAPPAKGNLAMCPLGPINS